MYTQTTPINEGANVPAAAHNNRIVLADCLEFMPQLRDNSVDFILTDPPYLVSYRARDGRTVPNDDNDRWLKPAFAEMYRILAEDAFCVSFYGWPSADKFLAAYREAGFRVAGHLMFPKQYASAKGYVSYQHECAHLLVKGSPWQMQETVSDVIPWSYSGNRLHPTQKPLSALLPLIQAFCLPEGLVFDPFAGSGSTLAAAKQLGRHWLGCELNATYHAIAEQRLSAPITIDSGYEHLLKSRK